MPATMVLLAVALATAGCATTQRIRVDSDPSGANVRVLNVSRLVKSSEITPTVLEIKKTDRSPVIEITKEGYEPVELSLRRGFNSWLIPKGIAVGLLTAMGGGLEGKPDKAIAVGFLAGQAVYWPISLITGDAYAFKPGRVHVALVKTPVSELLKPPEP